MVRGRSGASGLLIAGRSMLCLLVGNPAAMPPGLL